MIRPLIFISRVEPLREPEAGPTSVSHLRSSGSCLGATLTSIPLGEPFTDTSLFHYEKAQYDARYFSTYALRFGYPYDVPLAVLIQFLLEEVKLAQFILSHETFLLFEEDTQVFRCGQSSFLSL